MLIAITADTHLHPSYPERKEVLFSLFKKLKELKIDTLIIAGDLYDKEVNDYRDFDEILKNFPEITVYLVPGNHDPNLEISSFTSPNLKIINTKSKEKLIPIGGLNFLFLPYIPEKGSMDEAIEECLSDKKGAKNLVLVSHGDYITRNYDFNPYEDGFYFPLTSRAVEKYGFLKVFLGHIHKPIEYGKIFYPGSPCAVDISETGKRSFIIFDTSSLEVVREPLETPYIYLQETLTVYPIEHQTKYIEKFLEKKIVAWGLKEEELKKVRLKLLIRGYTQNKRELNEFIKKFFSEKNIALMGDEPLLEVKDWKGEILKEKIDFYKNILNELKKLELVEFEEGILSREDVKKEILKLLFE